MTLVKVEKIHFFSLHVDDVKEMKGTQESKQSQIAGW